MRQGIVELEQDDDRDFGCLLQLTKICINGRLPVDIVAAASLLIASRGGASPQKFEKRVLKIFRLGPDPYESAHQLDCSLLLPTAMANRVVNAQKILC